MKGTLLALILLGLVGCSDDATVVYFDKELKELPCLRLLVFPPDALIEQTLKELYTFDESCAYELQASQKCGIVCNSNQNAPKKALSNFPSGYIRLDIYNNKKPVYSYYKDLTHKATKEDIQKAFFRLQEDMLK
jgi:hypothetical protein